MSSLAGFLPHREPSLDTLQGELTALHALSTALYIARQLFGRHGANAFCVPFL